MTTHCSAIIYQNVLHCSFSPSPVIPQLNGKQRYPVTHKHRGFIPGRLFAMLWHHSQPGGEPGRALPWHRHTSPAAWGGFSLWERLLGAMLRREPPAALSTAPGPEQSTKQSMERSMERSTKGSTERSTHLAAAGRTESSSPCSSRSLQRPKRKEKRKKKKGIVGQNSRKRNRQSVAGGCFSYS